MENVSFQLYSAREFPPLSAVMDALKTAGYAYVEGYPGVYEDLAATKSAMREAGLAMPSGHFPIKMLENEPDRVVAIAEALGVRKIYCPYLDAAERPDTAAGWAAFARRLETLAKIFKGKGYDFGWHNHDFEFKALADGSIPMAILLSEAPGISWEADIAWIVRGGADPMEWISKHKDRITAVHVKDIAPAGECLDEDGWADVGHGTVDWPVLIAALKTGKAPLFVMEHDKPNNFERFAKRSIASVKPL